MEEDSKRSGYRQVRQIAIDEISLGKARKDGILVLDLESGRIIWVGQGRGAEALQEFWRHFKQSGGRLRAVAMDMSGAYAASVRADAPHAILTLDHFHVIKLMNEKLDDIRRERVREAAGDQARQSIKGLRWLPLHRKDNLEKDAASRLQHAIDLNQPLHRAYLLKEELGLIRERTDGRGGWALLRQWCAKARAIGIRQVQAMAPTLLRHVREILSDYKTRLSSGKMEGINRKIRSVLSGAFGFREQDFFYLRLDSFHEAKFKFFG